jgi:hypothetical protein
MPLRGDCIAPGFGAVPRLATEVASELHREPLAQPPRCHYLTSYARARDRTRLHISTAWYTLLDTILTLTSLSILIAQSIC